MSFINIALGETTDFSYDAGGRLASLKDPFGFVSTIGYDSEGRLGDITHSTLGTADFAYDSQDRLTRLTLGNGAYTDYARDAYGRLTSFDIKEIGGTRILKHEWAYDSMGRKSAAAGITVSGSSLPSPISFSYDAASRVTQEALNGQWSVGYDYDTLGRLLRRTKASAAGTSTTINYWLGLNKLAEERIVDDGSTAIVRPDSEESYPEANGWGFYDIGWDFTLQYDEDSVRGQVLTLAAIGGAASMIVGDDSGENYNGNATAWAAQGRRQLGFWLKNDDEAELQITVFGRASSGYGTLVFDTGTGTDYTDSGNGCYVYYLGNANRFPTMNDGNWHYIELDLGAYQAQFSGVAGAITHVDGLAFTLEESQIQLDDIILSAGSLERSYGLIPNAEISGYLGAQTGSTGAKDVNTQAQCVDPWSRYYYHFSDLGTVMATSNVNGGTLGAYEPDFFGNYKYLSGYKPDTMGITGTFIDTSAGMYSFLYRWNDAQRGRWSSLDPLYDNVFVNRYATINNNVINGYDFAGLAGNAGDVENCQRAGKKYLITKDDLYNAKVKECITQCATASCDQNADTVIADCVQAIRSGFSCIQATIVLPVCLIKANGNPRKYFACYVAYRAACY